MTKSIAGIFHFWNLYSKNVQEANNVELYTKVKYKHVKLPCEQTAKVIITTVPLQTQLSSKYLLLTTSFLTCLPLLLKINYNLLGLF